MKAKRTKAVSIPAAVKQKVFERDEMCCIYCGNNRGLPNAHYIPRSRGGLGIEENILTLCWQCHLKYDQGGKREEMKDFFKWYLKSKYPEWDETKLIYKK